MTHRYLLLLLSLLLPGLATAQTATADASALTCAPGTAQTELNVNNVRARLINNGGLFFNQNGDLYNVPASPQGVPNALFAAGIWIGGKVNGELRAAAADYGSYEFWPGPLDASGQPPADCAPYDRIFRITQADLNEYEQSGAMSDDLRDWPYAWGAPVIDGDGDTTNYNLAGGDRPEVLGHETHWWVMNDAAGTHQTTATPPIGMEVQTTAFGVAASGDLGNTTFYRYRFTYRGTELLEDAHVSFFVDPDLGNATDDYVGSSPNLDMGFAYNSDNTDEGSWGYGQTPPAIGVMFLEAPGSDPMGAFTYWNNGAGQSPEQGTGSHWYNLMQGLQIDGQPFVTCGDGVNTSGLACAASAQPTKIIWPGDPVTGLGWSERNFDGAGNANPSNDRRFLMSTEAFTMQPGETEELVIAIVWARGTDNLNSVSALRSAATLMRNTWEQTGLDDTPSIPGPAAAPTLIAPADAAVGQPAHLAFYWEAIEGATNYDIALTGATWADTLSFVGQSGTEVDLSGLGAQDGETVTWRVRGRNAGGVGPWSAANSFTTSGEVLIGMPGGIEKFLTVANANGALDPAHMGTFAFNANGFPTLDGEAPICDDANVQAGCNDRPTPEQQVGPAIWGINVGGSADGTFATYMNRSVYTRPGNQNGEALGSFDYEWRFTGKSIAYRAFADGDTMTVPFELWNIGSGTPDDPNDDYRMIPIVNDTDSDGVFNLSTLDHPVSGADNDPATDWVYFYNPVDTSPGTAGYDKWVAAGANANDELGAESLGRQVIVGFNLGTAAPYAQALPEEGTIFRIVTLTPNISAPVAASPTPGAELDRTTTTLYWQQATMPGAQTIVEVARDADFTDVVHTATLSGTSHSLWGLTPGTTYYWRVRQSAGALSPWSASASFTVSATATGVAAEDEMPQVLTLGTVAPHPVAQHARIRFGLPEAGDARVTLYDVLGREVQVLTDGSFGAGWHTLRIDAGDLASGVYFVRVTAGGEQQVKAVVVAR